MSWMAPIVVFGYNRPDHLRQTLSHLAEAEGAAESDLWIFCDGPKLGADASAIFAVRDVACDPIWSERFASVRIQTSEQNKGLACSVITGVSHVIEGAGSVIVVEDDVLVSRDFLRFMNDSLDFFRDDDKVGSITGFSPLKERPAFYTPDVMALPRNCSQCWATWSDRWREVDWTARGATLIWQHSKLRSRFNAAGNDRVDRLRRQLAGKIDSWSIRFGLWQALTDRHTIYPVVNRVFNIGYDGSGVHTRPGEDFNSDKLGEVSPYRLDHVSENSAIVRRVARIYGGPLYRRALRGVRIWLFTFYYRG